MFDFGVAILKEYMKRMCFTWLFRMSMSDLLLNYQTWCNNNNNKLEQYKFGLMELVKEWLDSLPTVSQM